MHEVCTRSSSLSSCFFFLPTSLSEQTAKFVQRRFASCVHSVSAATEQRQTRDEEEHAATATRQRFGDLQAGEGFAGAAGHDEFAAVGCEAREHRPHARCAGAGEGLCAFRLRIALAGR